MDPLSLSPLPYEVLHKIMGITFENEQELNQGRLVSDLFRKMIDNEVKPLPVLYSPEMMRLKTKYQMAIAYKDFEVKKAARMKTELELAPSLWSRLIKKICIDSQSPLIKTITRLIGCLFYSIRSEIKRQNDLENTIVDLKTQENEAKDKYSKFTPPINPPEMRGVKIEYQQTKKREHLHQRLMALFGSEEKFNSLPILDSDILNLTIEPNQMTARIMRGRTSVGQTFFTIKKDERCQTFYQLYSDDNIKWSHFSSLRSPGPIIVFTGLWINNGDINELVYQKLKNIIAEAMQPLPLAQ